MEPGINIGFLQFLRKATIIILFRRREQEGISENGIPCFVISVSHVAMYGRKGRETAMNLMDIIGPVMVGPSSSHTAGAAKIGKIILEDHISHCVVDAIETGDKQVLADLNEAINKFVK